MHSSEKYECKLPPETQLVALKELRETKHTRDEALEQMRDWIKKNPRIVNCRLGKNDPWITCLVVHEDSMLNGTIVGTYHTQHCWYTAGCHRITTHI